MVEQLRERAMLQKFVSSHAMTMIQEHKNITLGGERKTIAVVFTDIRNFTYLAETLPPEEVVSLLNTYLDAQMNVISAWNGSVDKFLGDGVMALFAGPTMITDAVRSAIAIQECLHELNNRRHAKGETTIKVGIGINTGPTVVGNIGSRSRMDFTAIGDVVNIASRLCALAEPNQILVSDTVMRGLDGSFSLKNIGAVRLKGKREANAIYSVQMKVTA
jgi:adenylate cyclase